MCNHCRREKAVRVRYSESVSVGFGVPHSVRMRHIVAWPNMEVIILPLM